MRITSFPRNNRDTARRKRKVITVEHTFIKVSDAFWSEWSLCVNLSPTCRYATRLKTTPPLAHPAGLAAQHIRLNTSRAQPEPSMGVRCLAQAWFIGRAAGFWLARVRAVL